MPLSGFTRRDGQLHCEDVPLATIAEEAGTPAYVYSASAIAARAHAYAEAIEPIPGHVHYAVKANSSLAVLSRIGEEGCGFDIVSSGELYRVMAAGGTPADVVFSGVGKTAADLEYALDAGVACFNCESRGEVELLAEIAEARGIAAPVALRVNPNVDAATHPYISTGLREHKFGVPIEEAEALYREFAEHPGVRFTGISCHIGSQIFETGAFFEALDVVLALAEKLRDEGVAIDHIDLGGGLGIAYESGETTASIAEYGERLREVLKGRGFTLVLEPGRSIVGEAGVLLTRVVYTKTIGEKRFVIVDAAMNDLIRPALYQAEHEIVPVRERPGAADWNVDVVGPVCESGDFLAKDRRMSAVEPGDLLAVMTAGAYGFVQASNYNSRGKPAEVLVEAGEYELVRKRESFQDLVRGETIPARMTVSAVESTS